MDSPYFLITIMPVLPEIEPVECCGNGNEDDGDDALNHARGNLLDNDEADDDDEQQRYIIDDITLHHID